MVILNHDQPQKQVPLPRSQVLNQVLNHDPQLHLFIRQLQGQTPFRCLTEADLQRPLRIYIGANKPSNNEPCESSLKARFPDLYTGKSHIDCFHFCQQCENHFETARATGTNRTSFAASSSLGPSATAEPSTKSAITQRTTSPSSGRDSKPFHKRTLANQDPLLTASGVNSGRTPSTSWKRFETEPHT